MDTNTTGWLDLGQVCVVLSTVEEAGHWMDMRHSGTGEEAGPWTNMPRPGTVEEAGSLTDMPWYI